MGKSNAVAVEGPDNWQARMDCDTLISAEQITMDKKRYKAALAEAKKRQVALADVLDDEAEENSESSSTSKKSAG